METWFPAVVVLYVGVGLVVLIMEITDSDVPEFWPGFLFVGSVPVGAGVAVAGSILVVWGLRRRSNRTVGAIAVVLVVFPMAVNGIAKGIFDNAYPGEVRTIAVEGQGGCTTVIVDPWLTSSEEGRAGWPARICIPLPRKDRNGDRLRDILLRYIKAAKANDSDTADDAWVRPVGDAVRQLIPAPAGA